MRILIFLNKEHLMSEKCIIKTYGIDFAFYDENV